jgi:hypothetical protein
MGRPTLLLIASILVAELRTAIIRRSAQARQTIGTLGADALEGAG